MTSIFQKRNGKPLSAELEARLRQAAAEAVRMLRDVGSDEGAAPAIELSPDADIDTVVETVLAVAKERAEMLHRLRALLLAHNDSAALALARELCNLPKGAGDGGKETMH